mgnify:CR=1 FL=1
MLTREQYESKINELTGKINNAQKAYYDQERNRDKSRDRCSGMHGWRIPGHLTECDAYKQDNAKAWANEKARYSQSIESAKNNLWEFQKQVAQDEQEAQIKAMREAIADQVRLEQEKIIQSEENQQIIINEPIQTTEPTQTTEPIKEKSIALGSLSLIGILIGGFLVLR